jgi:hypothetical protein
VVNLHLRFDEGRAGHNPPALLIYPRTQVEERVGRTTPLLIVRR